VLIFATIIAFGVVYNTARIALAERGRELATLRVLGYTRGEASGIMLGEIAAARGCSLPRSSPAASSITRASPYPGAASTLTSFGYPSVSVPVLSTTSVSTFRNVSTASALRNSTPSSPPCRSRP